MSRRRSSPGFSLVEVVVAVAIFAVAVSAILGLLPALMRQAGISAVSLTAARLPDALRAELQRVVSAGGFDALASEVKVLAAHPPETCELVADRNGSRLHTINYLPPPAAERIAADERYFLVEAWRFGAPPLAFETGGAVLALHVRVSWPYRIPGAPDPVPLADREQLAFALAINR